VEVPDLKSQYKMLDLRSGRTGPNSTPALA